MPPPCRYEVIRTSVRGRTDNIIVPYCLGMKELQVNTCVYVGEKVLGIPLALAIATLTVTIGGAVLATGGKKAEAPTSPPINAKSKDEESFVKQYIEKAADKVQGKQA
ncbi:hypothetical protein HBH70_244380 [Parastagonospora nodorum]|nr:hypothetical protein HBH47_066540 [Parastagonospora nodorum]KAH4138894.1 hypothetical protein HBH45_103040 [Parastagonospora nodorum]KAH4174055.1 hypothetical protein HBH43_086650 [Parastagonospora nodorum]KAH4210390.1 hypothetical protein HBI95_075040 [Parastagonospora nodorum]KAH4305247.1 hypothetical protein HBI01_073170 [Parastagonospora nodorum]